MSGERILVIGGNAAGMTAASRAKRLDPSLDITIIEAGPRIAYSICGLPYYLSGRVPDIAELELFTPESLRNERGIAAHTNCRAVEVAVSQRAVHVEGSSTRSFPYDRLLIATGYRPVRPLIDGLEGPGVFTASRLSDGEAIQEHLRAGACRRAAILGGGYVGLELAEALVGRGVEVTLVEAASQLMGSLDPDMAGLVEDELTRNGVRVLTGRTVRRIQHRASGGVEAIELEPGGLRAPVELVCVDVGVEPAVDVAASAGIALGASGGIAVSEHMETNVPGVYAAGNCAETRHLVTGASTPIPLGTVAAKQGRVAGENLAGRRSRFRGAVGTSAVKVFDAVAARTGLSSDEASRAGFSTVDSTITGRFRASYFDADATAAVKVIACRRSGRLLGAQSVGSASGAAAIDVAATAITAAMTVEEAAQLDLAYAPPVGALWHPLHVALNTLSRAF